MSGSASTKRPKPGMGGGTSQKSSRRTGWAAPPRAGSLRPSWAGTEQVVGGGQGGGGAGVDPAAPAPSGGRRGGLQRVSTPEPVVQPEYWSGPSGSGLDVLIDPRAHSSGWRSGTRRIEHARRDEAEALGVLGPGARVPGSAWVRGEPARRRSGHSRTAEERRLLQPRTERWSTSSWVVAPARRAREERAGGVPGRHSAPSAPASGMAGQEGVLGGLMIAEGPSPRG